MLAHCVRLDDRCTRSACKLDANLVNAASQIYAEARENHAALVTPQPRLPITHGLQNARGVMLAQSCSRPSFAGSLCLSVSLSHAPREAAVVGRRRFGRKLLRALAACCGD